MGKLHKDAAAADVAPAWTLSQLLGLGGAVTRMRGLAPTGSNNAAVFGPPIATGRFGRGPGVGGLFDMPGMRATKAAELLQAARALGVTPARPVE